MEDVYVIGKIALTTTSYLQPWCENSFKIKLSKFKSQFVLAIETILGRFYCVTLASTQNPKSFNNPPGTVKTTNR